MGVQTGAKPPSRLFYLDNIRIYLTITVILVHANLAYGGTGNWYLRDPTVDKLSPLFFTFFNAVSQSYFMSAFFLLAGYFTPRSFERKGAKQFLLDRLIRLGIPLVVYTTIIRAINEYLFLNHFEHRGVSLWTILKSVLRSYNPGHLWFLQLLLVFAVIYVIFRSLADQSAPGRFNQLYRDRFPPDPILFLCIGVLTVLMFFEHLVFPVGKAIFLNFQAGFFVHYVFCYYAGVLAYRGDWFRRLSRAQGRRWGFLSLVVIPFFFVIFLLGGALEGEENLAKFLGGPYWQSFVFSLWLTFLMVAIIVFVLYYFRERFHQAGPTARSMAANVFTVYIIHQTILLTLHILMLPVPIPTVVKFVIVSAIAVPVCFTLSTFVRKIPYARRVLG